MLHGGDAQTALTRAGFRSKAGPMLTHQRSIRRLRRSHLRHVWLLLAAVLGAMSQTAAAADGDAVFTVANYPVEARAENAVAAKDRALADGQSAAFRSLLKRLVPVTAHGRLRDVKVAKPGDLIAGIRVRAERNSPTEYIASLDFSFQRLAIRSLLQRHGLPFVEEQAPPVTLIPVWRTAGAPAKDDPAWTNVWRGLDLEHALSPVKLQPLHPGLAPEAVAALADGDGAAIRSLVAATKSELVLVALAEPDPAARKLHVILSGRDAVGAFLLKRSYRLDAADPSYAAEFAAVVSLGILEGRWKAVAAPVADAEQPPASSNLHPQRPVPGDNAGYPPPGALPQRPQPAPPGANAAGLQVAIEFQGMGEWQDISRKLAAVPGVQNLDVLGLSARGARVSFRYAEGPEQLAQVLEQQGLSLRRGNSGWLLTRR